ncbi:MAG: hypothetical protein PV344_02435, partial [Anaplasma sp.]|nr:hypothetical protein [Anaplasma sp.]
PKSTHIQDLIYTPATNVSRCRNLSMQNAVMVLVEKMFCYYHAHTSHGCDAQINLFLKDKFLCYGRDNTSDIKHIIEIFEH